MTELLAPFKSIYIYVYIAIYYEILKKHSNEHLTKMPTPASVDQKPFVTGVSQMWEKVLKESCSAQVAGSTESILIPVKICQFQSFQNIYLKST